ncbi:GNAT family N-acetyltransferase [Sphingobacterium olei]|uniref:GNAT family N-acetyltransferase n=1 Tax=Sphingobacterium olei TaxID=2571155 RepID=A0A4V5MN32_9SPHI|nr:GNAT family N-acetyltransferase [Sphingobacterium olei]TJZ63188.1 GNAT family N-acetyltransferase [Sphingobacterium olei]
MEAKLKFKKYQLTDFPDFYNRVKDDSVMKYITGKGLSEVEAKKKFESILKINQSDNLLGYFQILDSEIQLKIGECKLVDSTKDPSVYEIGYILEERFWGKGYGTQICTHMLELATSIDPTKNVIGIIDPENKASKKLLEKFGFISFFSGIEDAIATEKLILKRDEVK